MSSCWWVSKKNEFEYKLYSCKYIRHKEDLIISTMKTSTVLHDSLRSLLEIWVGLKGLWKTFEGALQPGRVLSRELCIPSSSVFQSQPAQLIQWRGHGGAKLQHSLSQLLTPVRGLPQRPEWRGRGPVEVTRVKGHGGLHSHQCHQHLSDLPSSL